MPTFDSDKAKALHREVHSHVPSDPALRVKVLESLAIDRGLISAETLDGWIEAYSNDIGPRRGAEVVARAWTDPDFKARLLADAAAAVREVGYQGAASGHLQAVENTGEVHNLVVCTLCSCYPFALLGMSPAWYKSAAYRARAVREPRKVLQEFGVTLPDGCAVKVWDSTAELRYIVIPERPAGTEGWSLEQLAGTVTRNAMIGTDRDLTAGEAA